MAKDTRIDFTTTTERKDWLKTTAERQEISVSQLLNRLIRNRMLQEAKYKKEKSTEKTEKPTMTKEELEAKKAQLIKELEEEIPF